MQHHDYSVWVCPLQGYSLLFYFKAIMDLISFTCYNEKLVSNSLGKNPKINHYNTNNHKKTLNSIEIFTFIIKSKYVFTLLFNIPGSLLSHINCTPYTYIYFQHDEIFMFTRRVSKEEACMKYC